MTTKTVLVTGANSGLGFDSSRQLAEKGWKVIISARSQAKADGAIAKLVERGIAASSLSTSIFDNNKPETIVDAVQALASSGEKLDAIVLNAGGMASAVDGKPPTVESGMTVMYTMNVHGHAVLVHGLLDAGVLTKGATIMFAGSEASRGIPAMGVSVPELPSGDVAAAVNAVVTGTGGGKYDPMLDYGMVKLIGTVWMRHLHQEHGLRALTVSPGFTGGTAGMDNLPAFQRFMFSWIALPIMKLIGNAHDLDYGARRYVQALEDTSLEPGGFYASPDNGISGDMVEQGTERQKLLANPAFDAAVKALIDGQTTRQLRLVS